VHEYARKRGHHERALKCRARQSRSELAGERGLAGAVYSIQSIPEHLAAPGRNEVMLWTAPALSER
jgi:hypothetical protein